MERIELPHATIPAEAEAFRTEVRAYLEQETPNLPGLKRADSWMGFDADFSARLGAAGLIGISVPPHLGGARRWGVRSLRGE